MAIHDLELWDGRQTWCHGWREGLPWWRWRWAPDGLMTRRQLHAAGRRLRPRQEPYGLICCHRGKRVGVLWRVDLTLPAARLTTAKRDAVAAMERGARTCPECHEVRDYRIPTSTKRCWICMAATGDYGEEPAA